MGRDFVAWDALTSEHAEAMTTEALVEHQMLLGPKSPVVDDMGQCGCEDVIERGRQLFAVGHDLVVLICRPFSVVLVEKTRSGVVRVKARPALPSSSLEEFNNFWDDHPPRNINQLMWMHLWAASEMDGAWCYSYYHRSDQPAIVALIDNSLMGLSVRCGSEDNRVLKISQTLHSPSGRRARQGFIPSGWKRLAVRTEDKSKGSARFFALEPSDTENELRHGPFFVKGHFKIARRVNNSKAARAAWKDFRELSI